MRLISTRDLTCSATVTFDLRALLVGQTNNLDSLWLERMKWFVSWRWSVGVDFTAYEMDIPFTVAVVPCCSLAEHLLSKVSSRPHLLHCGSDSTLPYVARAGPREPRHGRRRWKGVQAGGNGDECGGGDGTTHLGEESATSVATRVWTLALVALPPDKLVHLGGRRRRTSWYISAGTAARARGSFRWRTRIRALIIRQRT